MFFEGSLVTRSNSHSPKESFMKTLFRTVLFSSVLMASHSGMTAPASTREVRILWHRVCSARTLDSAVYMPHNKSAEAPLKIVLGPDARVFVPETANPWVIQEALFKALNAEESVSLDIPTALMNDRVVHPLLHQRSSVLKIDSEKLNRLQQKYPHLAVYVISTKGAILGSSSYLPRGIRYDEDVIRPLTTPNYFQNQALKSDGGFLVTLGFQSRRGPQNLTPEDLKLGDLCDERVTPLLVNFSDKKPRFTTAENGVNFNLVPGQKLKVGWPSPNQDVAWIVRDLNGNKQIDSGRELFGSETEVAKGVFAANGFAALALFDKDKNNLLDATEMKDLQLWFDKNGDGKTDAGELMPMQERLSEISLQARLSSLKDDHGHSIPLISEAKDRHGRQIQVLDYLLKTWGKAK